MQKPTVVLLTVISILSRLLPHPANFTTIGATALFAGSKITGVWKYLLPLIAMLLTDLLIGFHDTMLYVYISIVLAIVIGERALTGKPTVSRLATVALVNSTLFFVITNFGVWLSGTLYPQTGAGLVESYVMGLPFWRNMMAADIVFTVGFFKLYQLAESRRLIESFDKKISQYITGK
jgi:hypothetical protein